MCLLLETIRVEEGKFCHPGYHQARMDRSRKALFHTSRKLNLLDVPVPADLPSGVFKCRIIYGIQIEQVAFFPYTPKPIHTLVLVYADSFEYPFKYADRSGIKRLLHDHGTFDEIILVKNECITDTSFSNLAFLSGATWFTPVEPLLNGTCRQRLMDQGVLKTRVIKPSDLPQFSHVSLINAMLDLTDLMLPVKAIDQGDSF
ncbi:MAG: aminotransferase class IV [Bacteroidales bacterium]|nr:aminotransferase class IV [Bacteroidales bacterium]